MENTLITSTVSGMLGSTQTAQYPDVMHVVRMLMLFSEVKRKECTSATSRARNVDGNLSPDAK